MQAQGLSPSGKDVPLAVEEDGRLIISGGISSGGGSTGGLTDAQLRASMVPVDTLATPTVARVQATSATAANIVLTATCRRVSMYATQGSWYALSGTATATSHYIATGERLDFDVPASTTISVLQETASGSIRISELS